LLASLDTYISLQGDLEKEQSNAVNHSERIKKKLKSHIEIACEACKEESDDLYRMQLHLDQLRADRQALHQALEELDGIETETKERILINQEMASQQIESIDQVEANRMRQVPHLKKQISLYATTTGIKWDFEEEDVLAGQVVRYVILASERNIQSIVHLTCISCCCHLQSSRPSSPREASDASTLIPMSILTLRLQSFVVLDGDGYVCSIHFCGVEERRLGGESIGE
jgi:hypothetical protein